jgi:hypothetical protein
MVSVILLLLLAAFAVAPQHGALAQPNCFITVNDDPNLFTGPGTYYYRAVIGTTVISDVKSVTVLSNAPFPSVSLTLTVNPGVSGVNSATVQRDTTPAFSGPVNLPLGNFSVNCTNNNREFGGGCGVLGVDIAGVDLDANSTATLYVYRVGGSVVFEKTYTVTAIGTIHIQEPLPAAFDHTATYSYALYCTTGQCSGQSFVWFSAPFLIASGPLTYVCPSPCGPSLEGAPLGRMLSTVPLYWAASADAASTFRAEAGKTFKIIGSRSGFTRIALGCQAYWVPSESIAQCADPLCRD